MQSLMRVVLAGVAPVMLVAQQPQSINRDPQVAVQPQDRSVNPVDPDPEKTKQDASSQKQLQQQYSRWGLQGNQAQKTPVSGGAQAAQPASVWKHENVSADAMALMDAGRGNAMHDNRSVSSAATYKTATKTPRATTQTGQLSTQMPGTADAVQSPTDYLDSRSAARKLKLSSRLTFDPTRRSTPRTPTTSIVKPKFRKYASRAYVDSYCRTPALSMETKQACAQWQKKRSRSIH